MRHADGNTHPNPSKTLLPESAAHAVPTFIATDLLEKLIVDRDALAVRRAVTEGRRN